MSDRISLTREPGSVTVHHSIPSRAADFPARMARHLPSVTSKRLS